MSCKASCLCAGPLAHPTSAPAWQSYPQCDPSPLQCCRGHGCASGGAMRLAPRWPVWWGRSICLHVSCLLACRLLAGALPWQLRVHCKQTEPNTANKIFVWANLVGKCALRINRCKPLQTYQHAMLQRRCCLCCESGAIGVHNLRHRMPGQSDPTWCVSKPNSRILFLLEAAQVGLGRIVLWTLFGNRVDGLPGTQNSSKLSNKLT